MSLFDKMRSLLDFNKSTDQYTPVDYPTIFRNELESRGAFPDCYAFSLHKAGSTLMNTMIEQVCREASIPAINIPSRLFSMGITGNDWENDQKILPLIGNGRIYYGFRFLPNVLLSKSLSLREKKSVLLVRDPRDALTSQYYSFGAKKFSHKLPKKNQAAFLAGGKGDVDWDIDAYVTTYAAAYEQKLQNYKDNLDFKNVLLFRYEEIFFDKRKFLGDIFKHFEISVSPALLDTIAEKNDIRPEKEDTTKHIRKGTPGDHAIKLQKETIATLNNTFRDIAACFGYDLR